MHAGLTSERKYSKYCIVEHIFWAKHMYLGTASWPASFGRRCGPFPVLHRYSSRANAMRSLDYTEACQALRPARVLRMLSDNEYDKALLKAHSRRFRGGQPRTVSPGEHCFLVPPPDLAAIHRCLNITCRHYFDSCASLSSS